MTTVYRSKIDLWLFAVLAIAIGASIFGAMTTLSSGSPLAWVIGVLTVAIGAGLPLWLLLSTDYTLGPDQLLIRCGPFKWRILIADIKGVTPTSDALSSPALSLDRLRIDYGRTDSIMISPRNKEAFIRDLEAARRGAA